VNGLVSRPRHRLSLCAGGRGLDLGLMLAEPDYHSRAFVEWEDWPRAVLIAAQRAGDFAQARIWDDLRSFDARPFRGAFDIVHAGYPWRALAASHDLGPMDLAANGWVGRPGADKPV
jgi:site-specific DNA-cytosine methylase